MNHPEGAPPRATLQQVAHRAGVSPKTVSRVINGERWVSTATAEKVLDAAHTLGFRRNAAARDMQSRRPSALAGLVIGDVANPFYARIARGAERVLREQDLQLLTVSTDEDATVERNLVGELVERRVAGLLVATADDDERFLAREAALGTPVVFLDRRPAALVADTVVVDSAGGTARAIRHLLERGHSKIGFIGDIGRLPTAHERRDAFRDVLIEAGILDWDHWLISDAHDESAAMAATVNLLSLEDPPTAIFAANNRLAIGALRELRARRSPVALVSFDDFEGADLLEVSTVSYDPELMGQIAANMLLRRLQHSGQPPQFVTVPTTLVVRATSRTLR